MVKQVELVYVGQANFGSHQLPQAYVPIWLIYLKQNNALFELKLK